MEKKGDKEMVETEFGTFSPDPVRGAWYSADGAFYAPMKLNGSFDIDDIAEVTVSYENA